MVLKSQVRTEACARGYSDTVQVQVLINYGSGSSLESENVKSLGSRIPETLVCETQLLIVQKYAQNRVESFIRREKSKKRL